MPTNEDIAIWLGWRHQLSTAAHSSWLNPNGVHRALPDWRGDKTLWVEVHSKCINLGFNVMYRKLGKNIWCDIWETDKISYTQHSEDDRLAFWAAFDAWWEAEKGE